MPLFSWHEVVELSQPEDDPNVARRTRVSDPVPLYVFGSEPVSPMIWFLPDAPTPTLTVGRLQATLLVEWENRPSMSQDFCIEISQEAVEAFAEAEEVLIYSFVKDSASECYVFD
jgi:hypothetical protein